MNEPAFLRYQARYYHDGSWWVLEIMAPNWDDAEARCRKLGLQLDGEIMAKIPASVPGAGLLARAVCWWRNLWT